MRLLQRWSPLALALLAIAACGADDGDSGGADAAADSGVCGSQVCGPGQYCVHPCCGGGAPLCLPPPEDGGTCPAGTSYTDSCISTGLPGCEPEPCTPPPPYCSDEIPVGCSQEPDGQVVCVCS